MTTEGVDALAFGPSAADLKAAGKGFMLGYLDRPDSGMTAAAIASLHAGGIDVGCIAEWGASRLLAGAQAGAVDGQRAAAALKALGAPSGTAVYFAADWNANASDMPAIDAYLTAAASVLGLANTGIYGGLAVIRHVLQSKTASKLWQTYAWSGTPTVWAPGTHLQQYRNSQTVDFDRALVASWGQWRAVPVQPAQPLGPHVRVIASFTTYTVRPGKGVVGQSPRNEPVGTILLVNPDETYPYKGMSLMRVTTGKYAGLWVNPHGALAYSPS